MAKRMVPACHDPPHRASLRSPDARRFEQIDIAPVRVHGDGGDGELFHGDLR